MKYAIATSHDCNIALLKKSPNHAVVNFTKDTTALLANTGEEYAALLAEWNIQAAN